MANKITKIIHPLIIIICLLIIFIVGPYLFYTINYMGKIYPNIYVANINLGGMSQAQALNYLSKNIEHSNKIIFKSGVKTFNITTTDFNLNYNFNESVNRAFNLPRSGNFFADINQRVSLLFKSKQLGLILTTDRSKLLSFFKYVSTSVTVRPVSPSITLSDNKLEINRGMIGSAIDQSKLEILLGNKLTFNTNDEIVIPTIIIDTTLTENEALTVKSRAEKYLDKSITLKFESKTYDILGQDLFNVINPKGGYNEYEINNQIYKVSSDINRDPENAKFEFDGKRVTEFAPALDGIVTDSSTLKTLFISGLDKLAEGVEKNITIEVPIISKKPQVSTNQVNNLGIKELVGHATSTYFHSIPGRVYNVNLAASRINGTLVAPGETFSFNQTLGDVSKFTGYKEAYIISGGKTVLGDGGGVCQVSTTLFRATLNAGLPIDERRGHAYRVGYYEQNSPPGLDATVYSPTTDFKFTNDTGNHILIQAKNDPTKFSLEFNLYGTQDGRVATLTKPIVSNYQAPLPTVYQDDPTLPMGTLKQVDFAAAGAKITFDYKVARDNLTIYSKTFVTNYQPWANVYLRGTKI